MNRKKLLEALEYTNIEWRKHALERMFQRGISRAEVKKVIEVGEVIENYGNDTPFESALFFYSKTNPIHVVASFDEENMMIYIVTAYVPDNEHFQDDYKTRREDENR